MKLAALFIFFVAMIPGSVTAQQFWIVGGSNANEGQFPWIGDMRVSNQHHCGSSLIAPDWVLTAGHCAYTQQNQTTPMDTSKMVFRFNTISTNGSINPNGGLRRKAKKIFVHPSFSLSNLANGYDLALYQLSEPVTTIDPIEIAATSDASALYAIGSFVHVAGWGIADTDLVVTQPDTMKHGISKVFACNLPPASQNRIFCIGYTGTDSSQYHVGSAAGDSGGPAWVENAGAKKLTGVVSGGSGPTTTSDNPGIFTKVAAFRPWIDSIMNNTGTSVKAPDWNENDIKVGVQNQAAKLYFSFINAASVTCNMYNLAGQKVYTTEINSPSLTTHTIEMGTLPAGMYVVHVYNPKNTQRFSRKIIKAY